MSVIRPDWLPEERFPFTVHAADLPAGTVTYIDEGHGPPLLFVHVGTWSFVLRDVITRLRSRFRCITLDPPGFGPAMDLTGPPPGGVAAGPVRLETVSELIGQFVDHLDLSDLTPVVHDLGGPVTVAALADPDRPDRLGRLRGIVPTNTFLWSPDRFALRAMLAVLGGRTMTAIGTTTNLVPRLTSGSAGVGRHLDDGDREVFLGPYRERGPRRRFHQAMRSVRRSPALFDRLERAVAGPLTELPALTVYGERNDPFGFQDRMADIFTDHERVVIDAGNHFPMMDDPDRFAGTVADWHRRKVRPRLRSAPASD